MQYLWKNSEKERKSNQFILDILSSNSTTNSFELLSNMFSKNGFFESLK